MTRKEAKILGYHLVVEKSKIGQAESSALDKQLYYLESKLKAITKIKRLSV
jgi:hypothetical protein